MGELEEKQELLTDTIPEGYGSAIMHPKKGSDVYKYVNGGHYITVGLNNEFKICFMLPTFTDIYDKAVKEKWIKNEESIDDKISAFISKYEKYLESHLLDNSEYEFSKYDVPKLKDSTTWLTYDDYINKYITQQLQKEILTKNTNQYQIYRVKNKNYLKYISNSPYLICDSTNLIGIVVPGIEGFKEYVSDNYFEKMIEEGEIFDHFLSLDIENEKDIDKQIQNMCSEIEENFYDEKLSQEKLESCVSGNVEENPFDGNKKFTKCIYKSGKLNNNEFINIYKETIENDGFKSYFKDKEKESRKNMPLPDDQIALKKIDPSADGEQIKDFILCYKDEEGKYAQLFPGVDTLKPIVLDSITNDNKRLDEILDYNANLVVSEESKHFKYPESFDLIDKDEINNYNVTLYGKEQYVKYVKDNLSKDNDIIEKFKNITKNDVTSKNN